MQAKLIMDDEERSDLGDLEAGEPDWQRQFQQSHLDDPSVITAPLLVRMPSLERLDMSLDSQELDSERPLTDRPEFSLENPEYWIDPSVPSDIYKVVGDEDCASVASDSPHQIIQQLQKVQNHADTAETTGWSF